MGYLEQLALNKFGGDVDKARAWLSSNGKKGGQTGKKHFQVATPRRLKRIARLGQRKSVEARRLKKLPLDERIMQTYLED